MGTKKINKIAVFGIKSKKEAFIEEIQKKGIAQIIQTEDSNDFSEKIELQDSFVKTEQVINFLETKTSESFLEKNQIRYIDEIEFFQNQSEALVKNLSVVSEMSDELKNIALLKGKIVEYKNLLLEYLPFKNCDFSLKEIEETAFTKTMLVQTTPNQLKILENDPAFSLVDYDVLENNAKNTSSIYNLFFMKEQASQIEDLIKSAGIEEYSFSEISRTQHLKDIYKDLQNDLEQTESLIEHKEISLAQQASLLPSLRIFFDYLKSQIDQKIAHAKVKENFLTFLVYCWIPENQMPALQEVAQNIGAIDFEEVPLEEDEEAPVLIENNSFVRPFEFVTAMYSMPNKQDPDPTPFFSVFFAVFMGFCIRDVGYGFLLAAVSFFVSRKLRVEPALKKLMGICVYGGIMAIVIGVLTGTYFGIPFEALGYHVPSLFQPEKDIMLTLGLAIAMGYIHVSLGFGIKFLNHWQKNQKFAAIFDGLTHVLIMLSGLFVILGVYVPSVSFLKPVGIYLAIINVIAIWLTSGRHFSDAPVGRIIWGFYGVYELSAIFGDLLSYARLFALGLAGGIIGEAINKLAPMLIQGINFHGFTNSLIAILLIVIFLVILIGAHLFTMLLGILGAFIHTMRLQFVEFFGKFFQGGGEVFTPLNIQSKYYWLKNNNKDNKQVK